MQKIEHDLMGNVVVSETQPQGLVFRTRVRLFQLFQHLFFAFERFVARASKCGDKEFFDPKDFAWVADIEADWRKVRAELDALLPYAADIPTFQELQPAQQALTQDDGWKTFFFYAYGLKARANCRRCPETAKLLKKMPGMKTAFFSILAPGKHLPPHRGPWKGVLRLHLALLIPEPAEMCAIRVGSQTRHWEEGRVMIFDDTYEHEAWNRTDGVRVVLFVDIMRPMRFPANLLNAAFTWLIAMPFVPLTGLAGNYLRWEKRFEAIVNQAATAK
ncbi:aspartyl/asparaginyl beta-hydroxylase domain-containing protein [Mycobacterium sp. M23085]|uniref:aspartyl/asparaginyl beta-hydroxylase domain-containing protein n=1 Tax=Mycobacterium sp. M23085 TaxID=3378087 RepID=UPI003877C83B